jgi:Regulator of chromosome condensation (RCC1) repeat
MLTREGDRGRAELPGKVEDLDGWPTGPIVKIAAGGYTLAALNKSGDLYCWGGPPKPFHILDEISGTPDLVEIDDGTDVVDVAVAQAHMIVLTRDGSVYGIGSNANGQLGLGREKAVVTARLDSWTKLKVEISNGYRITGVAAGPMSSFILTEGQRKEPRDS